MCIQISSVNVPINFIASLIRKFIDVHIYLIVLYVLSAYFEIPKYNNFA